MPERCRIIPMRRMRGTARTRFLPRCQYTSTSWNTTTGCGSHGGRPPENYLRLQQDTDRPCAWWAASAAWSSGGGFTRTWRGPPSCHRSQTCIYSSSESSPCGRIPPTFTEANGWSDYARRRRVARGRTSAWQCWASSSWWARNSAASYSPFGSRTTTSRCGTGRRRTQRRRRAFGTPSAASCNYPPQSLSNTKHTETACVRPHRARPKTKLNRQHPPPRHPSPHLTAPVSLDLYSVTLFLDLCSAHTNARTKVRQGLRSR